MITEAIGNENLLKPKTSTERIIATIWQDLFGVVDIDRHSDFFALGGNSLTAIKFLSRVEELFGEEALLPDTLFTNGELASLAHAIDEWSQIRNGD